MKANAFKLVCRRIPAVMPFMRDNRVCEGGEAEGPGQGAGWVIQYYWVCGRVNLMFRL